MRWTALLALFGLLSTALPIWAQSQGAGLDAEALARIPPRMREFVDAGRVAGVVTLVARHGRVAALEAVGYRDLETKQPITTEDIFQLHSMTKPFVAVGVMMLDEEGKLSVSDPVEKHLPEFRGQRVIQSRDGDRLTVGPPRRPITIADLLTHTSGMPPKPPEGIKEIHGALHKTLNETALILSQQPLEFEPGTAWQYSDTGMATAGRIIEAVSGMPFEVYLAKRIFEPLGMSDTFIYPPKEKWGRMPTTYLQVDGWPVKYTSDPLGEGVMKYREGAVYPLPEGGLHSTASDLFRFYQMMLNGGELGGARLLSPETVKEMTSVHTGDLEARPGVGWGLGWQVVKNGDGPGAVESLGTFGHGGRYGTYCFIDPSKDLIGIFMIQRQGDSVERVAFEEAAYAALRD